MRRIFLKSAVALSIALTALPALAQETFRVGAYPANPPWQNRQEDGSFVGFEVDIVNEIAKRLDMTPEISGYDFRALFVATASGRVDAVISSLTITDERLEGQSFTQPYVEGALGIGVKSGSDIKSLEDLEGIRIGTIATSFPETWMKEREAEIGYSSLSSYDSVANMLTDLLAGRVDAVVNDAVGLRYAFTQMQGLELSYEITTGELFAMMMSKDSALLEDVNNTISDMKSDGTMAALYEKWLGAPPADGSVTVTPLPIPTVGNY
ncbi:ABC transporter substrate-binding protein [uncultured Paracoccus sp.]|uniref:ABC transporter substrate-binding protein n=1 Tax=uncultured Paracoccus sp. TaxID=189685 RepID=UPI00262FE081|nr:ABC transporter substrate-binding protein [uncultured Paracoccus sp.]